MAESEKLIPKHGGYRKLKSFQVSQLVYDITVRFCDKYIDRFSRTKDQMVQAARSGVQNIAEGSQASGTSRKTELRLTNVAHASLEELKLDYEDFLRQRGLPMLAPDHPILGRFKARRCKTLAQVRNWVEQERKLTQDRHGPTQTGKDMNKSVSVDDCPCKSLSSSTLVANAALSLLNLACYLLDRQLTAQAEAEGGVFWGSGFDRVKECGWLVRMAFFRGGVVFPLFERRTAFVSTVARAVEVAQCIVFKPRRHKFLSPKSGTTYG